LASVEDAGTTAGGTTGRAAVAHADVAKSEIKYDKHQQKTLKNAINAKLAEYSKRKTVWSILLIIIFCDFLCHTRINMNSPL
jgi:hypothetical protein